MIYSIRLLFSFYTHHKRDICSIISIFPSADWYEREVFDLFGVCFLGHPDLRRILTDYGFAGHPSRRDYPLSGYIEVYYDDLSKCIMYNNVNLIQDFRSWSSDIPRSFYVENYE